MGGRAASQMYRGWDWSAGRHSESCANSREYCGDPGSRNTHVRRKKKEKEKRRGVERAIGRPGRSPTGKEERYELPDRAQTRSCLFTSAQRQLASTLLYEVARSALCCFVDFSEDIIICYTNHQIHLFRRGVVPRSRTTLEGQGRDLPMARSRFLD